MGVASGCGCKEVYRFPHTTYPYSSCTFTFFGSLLLSREVSSTTFCTAEKTLQCTFFRGTLGYSAAREQEANLKAIQ